jgi:hypothetical protein
VISISGDVVYFLNLGSMKNLEKGEIVFKFVRGMLRVRFKMGFEMKHWCNKVPLIIIERVGEMR